MDKETLSHYGWIVILVLILAVLLALASPFGNFVAGAIKATTAGFFGVNEGALGAAGITIPGQEFEDVDTTPGCKHEIVDDTCTLCETVFTPYTLTAADYDAKMGTTFATDAVVVIPETFEHEGVNYRVTAIGERAFYGCSGLESIDIPDSVTTIKAYAFSGCTSLKSAKLPSNIKTLETMIFYNCNQLQTIVIPESVTTIRGSVFSKCASLNGVTIPNSVTSIGSGAFSECTSLTSITVPDGIKKIESNTFSSCSSLVNVNLPDGITSFGDYAFFGCGFTTMDLPDNLTSIGASAFGGCDNLTGLVFPDSVTSIGKNAFINCNFTSFTLPKNLTTINQGTFYNCNKLTTIQIPEGVTNIDYQAFFNCTSLKSIALPNTITKIDTYAFQNCSVSLKTINFNGTKAEWVQKGIKPNALNPSIICIDGTICMYCSGGTATCQNKAVCTKCGNEYGSLGAHKLSGNTCTICGISVTVIESEHAPYQNNMDNAVLGTWDYSDAQSVTITISYQTENTYDWVYLKSGNNYINASGQLVTSGYKFMGSANRFVKTFTTTALTGSVIFSTDSEGNEYYGVQVIVSPNY